MRLSLFFIKLGQKNCNENNILRRRKYYVYVHKKLLRIHKQDTYCNNE